MGKYLIDNNVISAFFSGLFLPKTMDIISSIIDETPNISVITEIEALSWICLDKDKENIVQDFIRESNIITITPDIVSQCVILRRSKKMKTPDAIIAATAIAHNLTLLSSDADFENIKKLTVINPLNWKY